VEGLSEQFSNSINNLTSAARPHSHADKGKNAWDDPYDCQCQIAHLLFVQT
jgi:hypothetical protein